MKLKGLTLALVLSAGSVLSQAATSIEDVIGSQLEAFNQRNVDDAWQYASPMIQRLFGNSRNFGAMVQNGYPMVWTNSVTEFLDRRDMGARQIQRVLISDAEGVPHVLEYSMIETADGWRIDGVAILPAPEVGA